MLEGRSLLLAALLLALAWTAWQKLLATREARYWRTAAQQWESYATKQRTQLRLLRRQHKELESQIDNSHSPEEVREF